MYFKEIEEVAERVDHHSPQLVRHESSNARKEKLSQFCRIRIILGNQVLPFFLQIDESLSTCRNPSKTSNFPY